MGLSIILFVQVASAGLSGLSNLPAPAHPLNLSLNLLQDIHLHHEAQISLAQMLREIKNKNPNKKIKVGVEGAAGPFNFEPFHKLPDQNLADAITKELYEEDAISGPIYAGYKDRGFLLRGIESSQLYRTHVEIYREAADLQKKTLALISAKRQELANRKSQLQGPVKEFDDRLVQNQNGKISFSEYLSALTKLSSIPHLSVESFLTASQMEQSLDPQKVESQKRQFIQATLGKLSPDELQSWIRVHGQPLGEQENLSARFDELIIIADIKGVDKNKYPVLWNYVQYLRLAESINPDALFKESRELEQEAASNFFEKYPGYRNIYAEQRQLYLADKLARFELTPAEWEEIKSARNLSGLDLNPFKKFYQLAEKRNDEFVREILEGSIDTVVVGGFHAAGLTKLLTEKGVHINVLRPHVKNVSMEDASSYLTQFTRKKTPLEKLFSDWKLFLSPPASFGTTPLEKTTVGSATTKFLVRYENRITPNLKIQTRQAISTYFEHPTTAQHTRSAAWLTETFIYLGLLATGYALHQPVIMALGVFSGIWLLTEAHSHQDALLNDELKAVKRMQRLVWSTLFTASYFVGLILFSHLHLPQTVTALSALSFPAGLHLLNHTAYYNPQSNIGILLFEKLGLPKIPMNADQPANKYAELTHDVRTRLAEALIQWKKSEASKSNTFENDPVRKILHEYRNFSIAQKDHELSDAISEGIYLGFRDANLNETEYETRMGVDTCENFILDFQMNNPEDRPFNRKFILPAFLKLQLELPTISLKTAASLGYNKGLARAPFSLITTAITFWRENRNKETLLGGDEMIRKITSYLAGEVETTTDSDTKFFVPALKTAYFEAKLTPQELRTRFSVDQTHFTKGFLGKTSEFGLNQKVLTALLDAYGPKPGAKTTQPVDPERYEALQGALYDQFYMNAKREMSIAIELWRAGEKIQGADPIQALLANIPNLKLAEIKSKGLIENAVRGFADAYKEKNLTDDEIEKRVGADVANGGVFWIQSGYADKKSFEIILDFQKKYRDTIKSDPQKLAQFQSGLELGLQATARNAILNTLKIWRQSKRDEIYTPYDRTVDFYGYLLQTAASVGVDRSHVVESLADAYVDGKLSPEELRISIIQDVNVAASAYLESHEWAETYKFIKELYEKIAEKSPESRDAIHGYLETELSPRKCYAAAMEEWKKNSGVGEKALKSAVAKYSFLFDAKNFEENSAVDQELDLAESITDAGMDAAHLKMRAENDLSNFLASWKKLQLPEDYHSYNTERPDDSLNFLLESWLSVAAYYAEDPVKVHAILDGLENAMVAFYDAKEVKIGTEQLRCLIPYMVFTAKHALQLGFPDMTISLCKRALRWAEPGKEAVHIAGQVYDLLGESYQKKHQALTAVYKGQEVGASIAWNKVSHDTHHLSTWMDMTHRVIILSKLFFRSSLYFASHEYLAFVCHLLESYPQLKPKLVPAIKLNMEGMQAVTDMYLNKNVAEWPKYVERIEVVYETIRRMDGIPKFESEFWLAVLYEVYEKACKTGDRKYLDKAMTLASQIFTSDGFKLYRAGSAARARRNLGKALAAQGKLSETETLMAESDAIFAVHDPEKAELKSKKDIQYLLSYAQHLIWKRQYDAAEKIFARIEPWIAGYPNNKDDQADGLTKGILQRFVLVHHADAQLAKGDFNRGLDLLRQAFKLPNTDNRVIPDLLVHFERTCPDAVFLRAIETLLFENESKGLTPTQRVDLIVFAKRLGLEAFLTIEEKLRKKHSSKGLLTSAEEFLKPIQPFEWPGRRHYLLEAESDKRDLENNLRGILAAMDKDEKNKSTIWTTEFGDGLRIQCQTLAAVYASMGMPEAALDIIKWGRDMLDKGSRRIDKSSYSVAMEDPAKIELPEVAGSSKLAVQEGVRMLRGESGESRMEVLAEPFILAASGLMGENWKSSNELYQLCADISAALDRIKFDDLTGVIHLVRAHLSRLTGDVEDTEIQLEKAIAIEGAGNLNSDKYRFTAVLETIPYILTRPSLSMADRIQQVETRLATFRPLRYLDASVFDYWELTCEFLKVHLKKPTSEDIKKLSGQAVTLAMDREKSMEPLLEYGLSQILVELALENDPQSPEVVAINLALERLDQWMGGRGGSLHQMARAFYRYGKNGEAFLPWLETANLPGLQEDQKRMYAMVSAYRGGYIETARTQMELMFSRSSFVTTSNLVQDVAGTLIVSPVCRRVFVFLIKDSLNHFEPKKWTPKKDLLKNIIMTGAKLGDPEIVYALDKLVRSPHMPKDMVEIFDESLEKMWPALTAEQWTERLSRLPHDERFEKLLIQAFRATLPKETGAIESIVETKRKERERIEGSAAKFNEAGEDYLHMDFAASLQLLDEIPTDLVTEEVNNLRGRVLKTRDAWENYQKGQPASDEAAFIMLRAMADEGTLVPSAAPALTDSSDPYKLIEELAILVKPSNGYGRWVNKTTDPLPAKMVAHMRAVQILEHLAQLPREKIVWGPEDIKNCLAKLNAEGRDRRIIALNNKLGQQIETAGVNFKHAMDAREQHDKLLNEIQSDRLRGQSHSEKRKLREIRKLWNETLKLSSKALELNGNYTEAAKILLAEAESLTEAGKANLLRESFLPADTRFDHAQDLAQVVYAYSLNSEFVQKALKIRTKARPMEILKILTRHLWMLESKIAADQFVEDQKHDAPSKYDSRLFTDKNWHYDPGTKRLFVKGVKIDNKRFRDQAQTNTQLNFSLQQRNLGESLGGAQTGASYQIAWPIEGSDKVFRINATYLRLRLPVADSDDQKVGLVFQIDDQNAEKLSAALGSNLKYRIKAGWLRGVQDISSLAQANAIEPIINRLKSQIERGQENVTTGNDNLDYLFSLRMDGISTENPDINFRNPNLQGDANQSEMVRFFVDPKTRTALVWGPPGTGKTTSLEEVCYQLTTSAPGKPGRIIIINSQSHFAVDVVAEKLKNGWKSIVKNNPQSTAQAIPFVRSAADETKVSDEIKEDHARRLAELMERITAHYNYGGRNGPGFVYLATNNGMMNDRRAYTLLNMYLDGSPMNEIREQYAFFIKDRTYRRPDRDQRTQSAKSVADMQSGVSIPTAIFHDEGGLTNYAETIVPIVALHANKLGIIGDHKQNGPMGMDEDEIRYIQEQVTAGCKLPHMKKMAEIFNQESISDQRRSIFKDVYPYAEKWKAPRLFKLVTNRRSHWAITTLVNIFYGTLKHRDQHKAASEWEKLENDTLLIVNKDKYGSTESEDAVQITSNDEDKWEQRKLGVSWRNFSEAGDVVRLVAYYLNRSYVDPETKTLKPFTSSDIQILTPYRGQNGLILDLLKITATLNDLADDKNVSGQEIEDITTIIDEHLSAREQQEIENSIPMKGRIDVSSIRAALGRLPTDSSPAQINRIYVLLSRLYDLKFDGPRKITREDVRMMIREDLESSKAKRKREHDEGEMQSYLDVINQLKGKLDPKTYKSIQGREFKVVILSTTRSNISRGLGFMADDEGAEQLNVALSRAQMKLAVVGSFNTLSRFTRQDDGWSIFDEILNTARGIYEGTNWDILQEAPRNMEVFGRSRGSLREAYGISLGSPALNRWVDVYVMPKLESAAFLFMLALGLAHGDHLLIAMGVFVKVFVMPTLHMIPQWLGSSTGPVRALPHEFIFSLSLLMGHLGTWAILSGALGIPMDWAPWLALAAPAWLHYRRNINPEGWAEKMDRFLGKTESLEVNSINGLTPLIKNQRTIKKLVPSVSMEDSLDQSLLRRRLTLSKA